MATRESDIKEIAKDIRSKLKKEFPKCKFAINISRYSMGQSMSISLISGPFPAFAKNFDVNGNPIDKEYAQLNEYHLSDDNDEYISNGVYLTKKAFNTVKRAYEISKQYNWDKSDPMTDYFNVNFYTHFEIGRWDKPYINKGV